MAPFGFAAWLAALLGSVTVPGVGDAASAVGFDRDVRPILAERCLLCHGPDAAHREAELRFDTREGLFGDLGGAHAVVPGKPEESELFRRVTAADEDRMPPLAHGERVPAKEVEILRAWIEGGAEWESHWAWAPLRDVVPPAVADEAWPRNEVDRFVLARLESEGLAPAPEADRRTLARRASLDLVGMPPDADELAAFLADGTPDAWERYVDHLLASPHFGEHWGRRWLDVARYADSHGFTIDGERSMWPYRDWVVEAIDADVPFDTFTIEQLAGDLLPDATREQRVATGFHRNTQINQEGGAKDEENRVNAVLDRVNTTASAWLGATMECAQCHDHKFDALTQGDYYRFYAFFDQTEDGGVRSEPALAVAGRDELFELEQFEAGRAERLAKVAEAQAAASEGWTVWRPTRAVAENGPELVEQADGSFESIAQNPEYSVYELSGPAPGGTLGALRLEALPDLGLPGGGPGRSGSGNFVLTRVRLGSRALGGEGAWTEHPFARATASHEQDTRAVGGGHYPAAGVLSDEEGTGWAIAPRTGEPHVLVLELAEPLPPLPDGGARELRVELVQDHGGRHVLGKLRLALAATVPARPQVPGDAWRTAWKALVQHERERPKLPTVLVLQERERPRTTRLFRRGNFLDPGEVVTPGVPAALNTVPADAVDPEGLATRLDLARWLVHPRNAPVMRVTVNRFWEGMFGSGLVETTSDFGVRGGEPSHPELLEWLAGELPRRGFSRKALLRLIATSATYRQASTPRPELADRDPRNRLLARQARLRLPAEAVRDSALRASGLLVPELGGPPVQPPQPDGVFAFTQAQKPWDEDTGPGRYRRTLYTRLWRSSPYPFLATFDFPTPNVTCTRRLRSSTALQALTMANDPMVQELAAGLGERMQRAEGDEDERLARGFELALGRPPARPELDVLRFHLLRVRELRAGREDAGAGAWAAVARVLLNTDAFVTRE